MRRDSNQQKIAIAVGIALSAGMFSIVPVAYGAPVGGTVTTGGASIAYSDAANGGKDTSITSTTMNNVIDWQDFSVAKGEKVVFDGGTTVVNENDPTKGAHNYMNIVSGANTSQIDGAIKGGNEVYIINPNGVIFGETASVDVGSLYASTRYVSSAAAVAAATAGDMTTVLADTSAGVATDVVNLGTINATNVVMEGQNVRFVNDSTKTNDGGTNVAAYQTTGVTASSVTLKADTADGGYIHVGNAGGTNTGYMGKSLATGSDISPVYYKLVGNSNWSDINSTPGGKYMLKEDISGLTSSVTNTFSGELEGNGYVVKDSTITTGGVFSKIDGGKLYNFGIKNSIVKDTDIVANSDGDKFVGAIANEATGASLLNVFNSNTSVQADDSYFTGGLIGVADDVNIDGCYNTGDIKGSGFFGHAKGTDTITIKNSYSTGTLTGGHGIAEETEAPIDINNVYVIAKGFFTNTDALTGISSISAIAFEASGNPREAYDAAGNSVTSFGSMDFKSSAAYTSANVGMYSISNTGGVTINENTGAVTRPIWRIYEGQSTPVLTSQLKGITTVSYDYTHGSQSGVNYATQTDSKGNSYKVGADLTATSSVTVTNTDGTTSDGVLTYNGSYVNVDEDSLSFGGNADASLVSRSESGTTGVRNAKTKALFYSAQDGYDIVGGNVTMAKRQVTVEGTDLDFSHVYDGEKDVTEEFKTAFSASAGTGTAGGILTDDAAYVKLGYSSDFSAQFTDKKVENDKTINLTGSLTLETQKDSSGKAVSGAADILDNYVLADSSSDLSTTTVKGSITARPIYLTVTEPTDDRLNKTYDGTNAVNSMVSASDIFSLDGTTYAKGTQNPGYGKITGDTVTLKVGTATPVYVDVDDAGTVTTDDAANAGTHKILFSGIELEGADAGNYKLQYSDTHNDVSNSQAFLDGVIRPRLLASDGFQVKTQTGVDTNNNPIYEIKAANKVYDGTSIYKVPDNAVLVANTAGTDSNTGVIAADTNNLWFKLSSDTTKKSYFMDSSNAETDMAAGDKAAVKVAYAVDVATKDGYSALKGNYTFDEATANGTATTWKTLNNYIPDVTGNGTISRRAITVAANGVTGIDKPYDGNAKVVGTGYTTMGGQYLKYAADTTAKLLADDNSATATDNASWDITASYSDKNVARNSDKSVANKTVNFTVAITGVDAVNYTLNGVNAENASVTLTGTGKITPLALTPTFAAIEKTYNGTNRIDDSDSTATGVGTVTGLTYKDANGNEVTDNVRVTYQSGYSAANAYYVSEDYNGNAGENLAVYYPYLTLTGTDAVNYDLASTTGEGTGAINRRTILSNGFQVLNNGTAADGSKVYDGTDIYELPAGATLLADTTASGNTGVISRDQDNLWFTLSDNADSYFTNSAGTTRTSKVADASRIAYQAGAVTRTGYEYLLNNYKIGANEASAVNLTADGTYSVFGNGHIDRRAISIDINNAANINKEYNADTDLVGAGDINIGGAYLNYTDGSAETSKLLADDSTATAAGVSDTAAWSVSAAYDNKNVVRDDDGNVIDNGKTVNFKISITGADAANYTLNGFKAETTGAAPITLTGTGKITPKELTASFSPVSKIYNGTTRINDQNSSVTGNGTVTPLTGDTVTLNYNEDEAYYDTPDVGTDKTVYYPNLTLIGADSGNYKLSSTIGLGTGRIDTATVTLDKFVFNFAGVKRGYNGELAVADSAQGITADRFITDSYIDLGTGTFDFRNYIRNLNANYANKDVNANTGTGNVTYSFTLADMTIPNISITGDYKNYFANNPVTRSVGTITPKTVYATINNPVVKKTYNGLKDVQNYTSPLVSYSGLVGNSADVSTAEYLDKNQGTDKLVQYNVAISDGSNYSIQYNSADPKMANYKTTADGPAVTAGTVISTVVTPNNVINPKDVRLTFADVTKQYDGTTSVQPVANQVALGADTINAIVADDRDDITVAGWSAAYNSPDVLTAGTVTYRNITLSGNDNGNYNFIDANGKSLNANTVIDGKGKITPLALSGTYVFTLGEVTKEYDSTNAIKFTGTGTDGNEYYRDGSAAAIKNFITAPSLTINGASRQMGYELDMGNTGYNDTTVGEHPATFRVGISNSNYTFDSITVTDGTNTLTPTVENGVYYYNLTKNNATITPRHVYVALNDNPAITKVYDGTNAVEQVVTGNNNKVYMPDSTDFISGDDVDVDWDNIRAVYSSENVAYDAGNVTSQNVIYTVGLTGTDAGNYVLYRAADNTAITDANKLTGTGIITPRELTVDFARNVHIFDNSAYLTNPGSNLQLGNLANRDAGFDLDEIAKAAIGGRYTDKNVNRADDGTVLDKGLTYNNLQNALAGYATRNAIAKNYIMPVDSVTYSVDDAKGVIKPLEITDPLKAVWQTGVNKVYDATTNLPTDLPAGTNANNILTLQVNTAYDGVLSLQGGEAGYQYSSAGYASKNVGDRALTYTLTGVKAAQGNYQLADAVVRAALESPWVSTDTARNADGQAVTGNISARPLTIMAGTDSKVYDGSNSVATAPTSLIHFSPADQAVINADTDGVSYDVTAVYNNKNAGDQTIGYTLTLNGNGNGNYVLNSSTATIAGNTASGTTTGNIAKRKVYVTADNINNINKEYDTTNALPDDFVNADHFRLTPTNTDTGIVAGEEDIKLNIGAIQGAYNSEHAGRRTINFNNFALEDTSDAADSGRLSNYTLETTSITGSGTIYPKSLTIGINAAPTKEYDTRKALSADYATKDNLALSGVLGDDEVNFQVNSANYSDANAATGKTYSYDVSIDNTDYQLTQGTNMPAITVSNNGQTGVITADDGTITKRKVYVSLADSPEIVKTYDGDTKVEQDVTDKIIVRAGDLLNDGTTLNNRAEVINARYDSKDSGNHTVTYDVKLKGDAAGNYEIHRLSNINDAAADTPYSTLEGTGVINKAKLTLDPASISKTYNGTAVIGDGTNDGDVALTKDKLIFRGVNNESFTLTDEAFAKVIGQYGYGTGDANVSWVGEEVADKDILYTGLSDALTVMNADERTNAISKNYTIDQTAYFAAAQAKGKIKPITLTQAATANWKPVVREYNGDTDLTEVYDYSGGMKGEQLGINDILTLAVTDSAGKVLTVDYEATANYDDMNVGTRHNLNYHIASVNKKVNDDSGNANYVLDSSVMDALAGRNMNSSAENVYSVITPRTLTVDNIAEMTKVYDGTTDGVANAEDYITLTNYIDKDKDLLGFTAQAVYDNANAGTAEDSDGLQNHKVTYKLNLSNPNYQLAEDTITGTGTISRKGLTIVATPVSINSGEAMPKFSGTVEGLVSGDENLASSFVFDTMPTVTNTSVEKPNPVYGWYRNQTSGNFGLNYTFDQDAANDTAFTVKYVDSGRNNPDTKITPTHNVYQQISKDKGSGFGDNAAAALEYVNKNGQVIGRENIDSGEIHDGSVSLGNADDMTSQDTSLANIGIVGGDIVNVDGADAANMANIEVTDNGTTVNLEITSLSSGESGDKQAVAEITSVPAAADNSSAQIQNLDDRQDILEQLENKDKDDEKKESEIAIESQNNQNDDEIELKIEGSGVKVA